MKVYSVWQVNSYINNLVGMDGFLSSVVVAGEVSNLKYHSSGHIYFTLKDEKSAISCIMFAAYANKLTFRMREGAQMMCSGEVKVYERDGKYQLYVKNAMESGNGILNERFEQLKSKLEDMGIFSEEYKRPIPRFVRTLGIVTAPTGAAVRDMIQIARRRNPYIRIVLYPALVQGEGASKSIVNGIKALQSSDADVIIIGRGGGSIEDLWAFNEEETAMAVFDSAIPIISAVGHETDTTITDYVADLRAPTPSAAAELAVCDMNALIGYLDDTKERFGRLLLQKTRQLRLELKQTESRLRYLGPESQVREKRMLMLAKEEKLKNLMTAGLEAAKRRLLINMERMKGLSPVDKLSQGYSVVMNESGKTITKATELEAGDRIRVIMKQGMVNAQVLSCEESYGIK